MINESFDGLRVSVVGSCQASTIATAMKMLLPGASIEGMHIDVWPIASREELAEYVSGSDLIVLQADFDENDPLSRVRLAAKSRQVEYLPILGFTGFHPDLEYIFLGPELDANHITGPLHSSLLAASYLMGLPPYRAIKLFNAYTFARLGFLDSFTTARAALLHTFSGAGYDLSTAFDDWLRAGPFMYTLNHPASRVLATLARMVVKRAGLRDVKDDPIDVPDFLASSVICPIYPEAAQRLGIKGTRDIILTKPTVGERPTLSLLEFANLSYETYKLASPDLMKTPRVRWVLERLDGVLIR